MAVSRRERKRDAPVQEMLALLPSWEPVQRMRLAYLRRCLAHCGASPDFGLGVVFEFPRNISIGSNVLINRYSIITARAPISIGNDVLIGPHVIINSADHVVQRSDIPIRMQGHNAAPIVIDDDVWIGANAVILRGVRLGRGCIVGAGAVVTRDVSAMTVVGGVPARPLKVRRQ